MPSPLDGVGKLMRCTSRHGTPQCKPAHTSSVERAWAYVVCASFLGEALASSVRAAEEGKGGRVAHRVTSRRNSCSDAGEQLCACTGPSWARGRGLAASGGARGGCRAFPPKPVSPGDGLYLRSPFGKCADSWTHYCRFRGTIADLELIGLNRTK